MFAVCQQYNHYHRIDAADPWLEQFYSLEGLDVLQLDQSWSFDKRYRLFLCNQLQLL